VTRPLRQPLRQPLADYLALRRALGSKLVRHEKLLGQFLTHLEDAGISLVTVAAALEWAMLPAGGQGYWWGYRLSVVRGFAKHLHSLDPRHEVPPTDLLPQRSQRAVPYLYSDAEIAALIDAADTLGTAVRRATFATLIGLLRVTGMRIGEAIALDRDDIDLTQGRLLVRHGKFDKTRELWLHSTSVEALQRYRQLRDDLITEPSCEAFFVSSTGTRLLHCNVQETFHRLVDRCGLAPRSPRCRPRIHDLRHTFVVSSMQRAYADGEDGQRRLTLLSTWLGHVHPASTYWYLSASPELMALAASRLETHRAGRP
jgi:integrase